MRTNYVLIDFESVQPDSLEPLRRDHFRVLVFVGAIQSKISFALASALQSTGENAEYVKISGSGKNASDFHIALRIGQVTKDFAEGAGTGREHVTATDGPLEPGT